MIKKKGGREGIVAPIPEEKKREKGEKSEIGLVANKGPGSANWMFAKEEERGFPIRKTCWGDQKKGGNLAVCFSAHARKEEKRGEEMGGTPHSQRPEKKGEGEKVKAIGL